MNEDAGLIHEKFVFFSARKERETLSTVLDMILTLAIDRLTIDYRDRPSEEYRHFNDRTKKIVRNLEHADKVEGLVGEFSGGGLFELRGSALTITIPSDQYNFEVIDSMRRILSPILPLCIFQNPYIWGIDLYEAYERDRFFETRRFTFRSQHLEDPQIDIFRRDEGIIYKFRFHLANDPEVDEGFRFLHPLFDDLAESLAKRSYEGLEVLNLYCADRPAFRRFEPRTKLGVRIKSMLFDR